MSPSDPPNPSQTTTVTLLGRAHEGDSLALERICERYRERLAALALRWLASSPLAAVSAEAAVQSALLSFHDRFMAKRFPDLQDRESLWALLSVMARRKVLQALRRERRLKRGGGKVLSLQELQDKEEELAANVEPLSREPDPAEKAATDELLNRLMESLNEINRQIALLRLAGNTVAEIAAQVDRTAKAVERRLATIREKLRQLGDAE